MLHGHIFDTIAQNVCRTADFQPSKDYVKQFCYRVILND